MYTYRGLTPSRSRPEEEEVAVRERAAAHRREVPVVQRVPGREPEVEREVRLVVVAHDEVPVGAGRRRGALHEPVHPAVVDLRVHRGPLVIGVLPDARRGLLEGRHGGARRVEVRERRRDRLGRRFALGVQEAEEVIERAGSPFIMTMTFLMGIAEALRGGEPQRVLYLRAPLEAARRALRRERVGGDGRRTRGPSVGRVPAAVSAVAAVSARAVARRRAVGAAAVGRCARPGRGRAAGEQAGDAGGDERRREEGCEEGAHVDAIAPEALADRECRVTPPSPVVA